MLLVTGGCGYIGSHIVKLFSENGEKVVVFDNLSQGSKSALLHNEELVIGNITDPLALKNLFDTYHFDAVIHLAALVNAAESNSKKDEYQQVNDHGSRNIWEAGVKAGVKTFLYASSAAVYGTPLSNHPLSESSPLNPSNVYGTTKLAGESSLQEVVGSSAKYGIFRFFNVAGAEKMGRLGQSKESRAIMQRLFALANNETDHIVISGHDYDTPDGTVVRDFVHVEDIAKAFTLALKHLQNGKDSFVLNLGSGATHTIGEVVQEVSIVTNKNIPIVYAPRVPGDISYSQADITLATELLGWSPTHTFSSIVSSGWNAYIKNYK